MHRLQFDEAEHGDEPKTATLLIFVIVGADEDVEHQFHNESRYVGNFGIFIEKLRFLFQQHALDKRKARNVAGNKRVFN